MDSWLTVVYFVSTVIKKVSVKCLFVPLVFQFSTFLADRTNGRTIATLLRLSSVTLCIVAKRCILEQKLLLRAYRKSYMRNRLVPK